jgi:SPP1 family predicted phage head-tail adaptor
MANFFRSQPTKVKLQQLTGSTTAGSRGESDKTWQTIETVYASIKTLRGDEMPIGRQIDARATHQVEMHYTATATPLTRILHGSKVYNIESIDNVEQLNRWLILQCVEVVE